MKCALRFVARLMKIAEGFALRFNDDGAYGARRAIFSRTGILAARFRILRPAAERKPDRRDYGIALTADCLSFFRLRSRMILAPIAKYRGEIRRAD